MKQNCWEFKKCGREPDGEQSRELGVCPASTEQRTHGVNQGINGGRACWAVSGTLCGGEIQGAFAQKLGNCLRCEFYEKVRAEESNNFVTAKEILNVLNQQNAA